MCSLNVSSCMCDFSSYILVARSYCYLLLATCYLLLATCDLRLATCDLRLATCDLRLATCYLHPTTTYYLELLSSESEAKIMLMLAFSYKCIKMECYYKSVDPPSYCALKVTYSKFYLFINTSPIASNTCKFQQTQLS